MANNNILNQDDFPSSKKLFCGMLLWGNNLSWILKSVFPGMASYWQHLLLFSPFILIAMIIKKDDESIWQWIERCGMKRFSSKRFWYAALVYALVFYFPVVSLFDLVMIQRPLTYFVFYIPSLVYALAVQTFVEEWWFRRSFLKDRSLAKILSFGLAFAFMHIRNPGILDGLGLPGFCANFLSSSFVFSLPVILFDRLEYSWGFHFINNLIVSLFFSASGGIFSPAQLCSGFRMSWGLAAVVFVKRCFQGFVATLGLAAVVFIERRVKDFVATFLSGRLSEDAKKPASDKLPAKSDLLKPHVQSLEQSGVLDHKPKLQDSNAMDRNSVLGILPLLFNP